VRRRIFRRVSDFRYGTDLALSEIILLLFVPLTAGSSPRSFLRGLFPQSEAASPFGRQRPCGASCAEALVGVLTGAPVQNRLDAEPEV
jgi:hypothetical protein